ncbi:MAG: DALR anticodon-binding domain-containing protein, partial [Lachnospiraceae bacterium]
LSKYQNAGGNLAQVALGEAKTPQEKNLMLEITKFNTMIDSAYEETAPHKICAYIYDLCNAFNSFYHETKIMTEEDEEKKAGYIALLILCRDILETSIDLLGFSAPERM